MLNLPNDIHNLIQIVNSTLWCQLFLQLSKILKLALYSLACLPRTFGLSDLQLNY